MWDVKRKEEENAWYLVDMTSRGDRQPRCPDRLLVGRFGQAWIWNACHRWVKQLSQGVHLLHESADEVPTGERLARRRDD